MTIRKTRELGSIGDLDLFQVPSLGDNFIYFIVSRLDKEAIVVDPGEVAPVLQFLESQKVSLAQIWITHHHSDHIGGVSDLVSQTGADVFSSGRDVDRVPHAQAFLSRHNWGGIFWEILAVPGHTQGHVAIYSRQLEVLFCGDTLFTMGCGGLFEGTAEQLFESLEKIKLLPPSTRVCCAHEYTMYNLNWALKMLPANATLLDRLTRTRDLLEKEGTVVPTTLGEELTTNPFLRCDDPEWKAAVGLSLALEASEVFAQMRNLRSRKILT